MSRGSSSQAREPKTRVALLGTIGELHTESLTYNLERLRTIIVGLAPDLLCAEIQRPAWERGNLVSAPVELRQALTPVAKQSDVVLVPISPSPLQFGDLKASTRLRQDMVRSLERLLRWGQRRADRPEAINGRPFETFCRCICFLTELLWVSDGRVTWRLHTRRLRRRFWTSCIGTPAGVCSWRCSASAPMS